MQYIFLIAHFLITGFIPATIIWALGWFLWPRFRETIRQLVVISNTLLLAGACLFLFFSLFEFFRMLTKSNGPDFFDFSNPYLKLYWLAFLIPVIFKGLAPQVLWSKRRRASIEVAVTLLFFLLLEQFIFIKYAYGDTLLASGWDSIINAVVNFTDFVLPAVGYMVLVAVLYGVKRKQGE